MSAPWMGDVAPFTVADVRRLRASPPPNLHSQEYVRDYIEVKRLGARFGSERTTDQTDLSNFWSDNFFGLWERTLRSIAMAHITSLGDTARLFALANMAAADAVITAWADKKAYNFWRPLTAIREGDRDGNPRTTGDATWEPYLNTPNYPDHSSGANNVTAAMTRTLAHFFGTDAFDFSIMSAAPLVTDPAKRTRPYTRFSQAADEVVVVRVYQGIHFRSADEDARRTGEKIADHTFRHFLRPVGSD